MDVQLLEFVERAVHQRIQRFVVTAFFAVVWTFILGSVTRHVLELEIPENAKDRFLFALLPSLCVIYLIDVANRHQNKVSKVVIRIGFLLFLSLHVFHVVMFSHPTTVFNPTSVATYVLGLLVVFSSCQFLLNVEQVILFIVQAVIAWWIILYTGTPSYFYVTHIIATSSVIAVIFASGVYVQRASRRGWSEMARASQKHTENRLKILVILHELLPGDVLNMLQKLDVSRWHEVSKSKENVAVVFVSIKNLDQLTAKLKTGDLVTVLHTVFSMCDRLLSSMNVNKTTDLTKIETVQDTYLVCSGLLTHSRRYIINACSFASEIVGLLNDIPISKLVGCNDVDTDGLRLLMSGGVAVGPVLTGVVGSFPRFCIFGSTVNRAARLMQHAHPGDVMVTQDGLTDAHWIPHDGECDMSLSSAPITLDVPYETVPISVSFRQTSSSIVHAKGVGDIISITLQRCEPYIVQCCVDVGGATSAASSTSSILKNLRPSSASLPIPSPSPINVNDSLSLRDSGHVRIPHSQSQNALITVTSPDCTRPQSTTRIRSRGQSAVTVTSDYISVDVNENHQVDGGDRLKPGEYVRWTQFYRARAPYLYPPLPMTHYLAILAYGGFLLTSFTVLPMQRIACYCVICTLHVLAPRLFKLMMTTDYSFLAGNLISIVILISLVYDEAVSGVSFVDIQHEPSFYTSFGMEVNAGVAPLIILLYRVPWPINLIQVVLFVIGDVGVMGYVYEYESEIMYLSRLLQVLFIAVVSLSLSNSLGNIDFKVFEEEAKRNESCREMEDLLNRLLPSYSVSLVMKNEVDDSNDNVICGQSHVCTDILELQSLTPMTVSPLVQPKLDSQQSTSLWQYHNNVFVFQSDIVAFSSAVLTMIGKPVEFFGVIRQLYGMMDEYALMYGLWKMYTIGDAYVAVAGFPSSSSSPSTDPVASIIKFTRAVNEGLKDVNVMCRERGFPEIALRIGLAAGSAVTAIVGEYRPAYLIWGQAPDRAAQMEKTCHERGCLVHPSLVQWAINSYKDSIDSPSKGVKRKSDKRHRFLDDYQFSGSPCGSMISRDQAEFMIKRNIPVYLWSRRD